MVNISLLHLVFKNFYNIFILVIPVYFEFYLETYFPLFSPLFPLWPFCRLWMLLSEQASTDDHHQRVEEEEKNWRGNSKLSHLVPLHSHRIGRCVGTFTFNEMENCRLTIFFQILRWHIDRYCISFQVCFKTRRVCYGS